MSHFRFPLIILLAFAVSGCDIDTTGETAELLAAAIRQAEVEHQVQTARLWLPEMAAREGVAAPESKSFTDLLALDDAGVGLPESRARQLREAYGEEPQQRLFGYDEATDMGAEALRLLREASRVHGLAADELSLELLEDRLERLDQNQELGELFASLELEQPALADLLDLASGLSPLSAPLLDRDHIFRHAIGLLGEPLIPELSGTINAMRRARSDVDQSGPELELLTASALMDLAQVLRFNNTHYISRERAREEEWDLNTEAGRQAAIDQLSVEWLAQALEGDVAQALSAIEPPFQQYQRLKAGLARYIEIVESGGWQPLSPGGVLGASSSGEAVLELRQRLKIEGYLTEAQANDERWTNTLSRAVRAYQDTHQLRPTGRLSEETRTSLDIPASRRAAQIALTLQRWRESRIGADHERDFITVNVPDFHAELWEGDRRLHRWKVIIGSTRRVRDERTRELRLADATPLFSRSMRYIVFNPYWNVPPGIRARDYTGREDDPEWLEENGFEVFLNDEGERFLRQLPGPDNALGGVKFLFPNDYHVYMHDTPHQNLFNHEIRAYSSGCIRVEDPMYLAHLLISRDRNWSAERTSDFIEDEREKEGEQWFTLRRPVPVHIEYYVVRGDAQNRMHFLADIYRHDRDLLDEVETRLFGDTSDADIDTPTSDQYVEGP